jgi:hypothetical protein
MRVGNLQFAFDTLFQAHGMRLDVASKETALDSDGSVSDVKVNQA